MKAADYCADIAKALEAGPTGSKHGDDWMAVGSTIMLNSGRPVWARIATCEHEPNARYIAACHPAALRSILEEREQSAIAVAKMAEEVERLRAEVNEQARVNGMGAERELALAAECERLRKDAAMLNWLERQHLEELGMGLVIDAPNDGKYYVCGDSGTTHYGKTLREALGAAMGEQK